MVEASNTEGVETLIEHPAKCGRRRVLFWMVLGVFLLLIGAVSFLVLVPVALGPEFSVLDADGVVYDDEAPVITLKGEKEITLVLNDEYKEPGAEAADNCDETVAVEMSGRVNTKKVGRYLVSYTAVDDAGNVASAGRVVNVVNGKSVIYLTFDDGPGPYTAQLLDILKKYNVKATFFVTGAGEDEMILREYEEGHSVGLHTWSHNYAYIYQSMDNFFADLDAVQERVKNITGKASHLIRFPGGSSNTVSAFYDGGQRIMSKLVKEVEKRGFTYFDWNITSGDAGETIYTDVVYENVINHLFEEGNSVVLQHDIKDFSVNAVEGIIQYGLAHGYRFLPLTETSFPAHHGVNN